LEIAPLDISPVAGLDSRISRGCGAPASLGGRGAPGDSDRPPAMVEASAIPSDPGRGVSPLPSCYRIRRHRRAEARRPRFVLGVVPLAVTATCHPGSVSEAVEVSPVH